MKYLIAGGTGLVGSAIVELLKTIDSAEIFCAHSKIVDFRSKSETLEYVSSVNPDVLIDAAAKVGGIVANNSEPFEFLITNLQIQNNLMFAALKNNIRKFVFLGSSCIYPKDAIQPIREEYFMTGPLEKTNSAYAIAKIAGIELVRSARKEYGLPWISLMPTNVYGPKDNFTLTSSHVLPALIRRFTDAQASGLNSVTLWGDGSPLREFIYSQDLAEAVLLATNNYNNDLHLNIGSGAEVSIKELALMIAEATNFQGEIKWDLTKPNGTQRKLLDSSRIHNLGWRPKIDLKTGLELTLKWYQSEKNKKELRL